MSPRHCCGRLRHGQWGTVASGYGPSAHTAVAARVLCVNWCGVCALCVAVMAVAPVCAVSHDASESEHHVETTTNLDRAARLGGGSPGTLGTGMTRRVGSGSRRQRVLLRRHGMQQKYCFRFVLRSRYVGDDPDRLVLPPPTPCEM